MATYKVLSDNFSLGKQGETIDSDLLIGCNIQALIDGEHLAEVNVKASKPLTSEQEK
jgi:hypothetical protein